MKSLKSKKILMFHHWNYSQVSHFLEGTSHVYVTSSDEMGDRVINLQLGAKIDVPGLIKNINFKPDLIIAKVDAFFNVVPANLEGFNGTKILILGDTQHGDNPLINMINYAKSEPYDYYITDHKRHHLRYYELAGVGPLFFIPGLFHCKYNVDKYTCHPKNKNNISKTLKFKSPFKLAFKLAP